MSFERHVAWWVAIGTGLYVILALVYRLKFIHVLYGNPNPVVRAFGLSFEVLLWVALLANQLAVIYLLRNRPRRRR